MTTRERIIEIVKHPSKYPFYTVEDDNISRLFGGRRVASPYIVYELVTISGIRPKEVWFTHPEYGYRMRGWEFVEDGDLVWVYPVLDIADPLPAIYWYTLGCLDSLKDGVPFEEMSERLEKFFNEMEVNDDE